jgi:hypothetical protein
MLSWQFLNGAIVSAQCFGCEPKSMGRFISYRSFSLRNLLLGFHTFELCNAVENSIIILAHFRFGKQHETIDIQCKTKAIWKI